MDLPDALRMSDALASGQIARRSAESDSREHVTGTVWEPGDRASAAIGHMVRRAMEHGVDLA